MASIALPARPGPDGARLRILLVADGPRQPRWLVEAVARIARAGFATLLLAVVGEGKKTATPWWWPTYQAADRRAFGIDSDLSAPVEVQAALPDCQCLTPPEGESGPAAWRQTLAAAQPDLVFLLGDLKSADFDALAPYGVWRYSFGDSCSDGHAHDHDDSEAWAGWREVAEGLPVTLSGLRVVLPGGEERLFSRSSSRTFPFSVARNRANLLRKATLFAERELRALHRLGPAYLARGTVVAARPDQAAAPGGGELLWGLARIGGRVMHRSLEKLRSVDQWFIAYRFGRLSRGGDWSDFTRLQPPRDRIWADPFPLLRDGRYFLFFEEVVFATGKGHIVMVELQPHGGHTEPVVVLERDYHLSYPFLIEQGSELFMVPESGENHSVELYRCEHFPDVWRLEKTLLSGLACADASFHHDGKRWWMFVNVGAEGTELYDELHLYYADDLLGEWQPHPANPVKSDVYGARPAGRLFLRDGVLHRPAQICAPLYGSGISIARVDELSPSAYREEEVERIVPPPASDILGIHTINRAGMLQVVDSFARCSRV